MAISHNEIPNTIRTPLVYIEIDNSQAVTGTPSPLHKTLLIAHKNEKGTMPEGEVVRVIKSQAQELFGPGSMGDTMATTYYANNSAGNLYAVAVPDTGTAATGRIAFTGTPDKGGVVHLYIAGEHVQITLTREMTEAKIIAAVSEAINNKNHLPVTAIPNEDAIELSCKWKGESGNDIDLRFNYQYGEKFPQGIGANVTKMSGGAGNPDISDALIALGSEWYQHIIMPFTDANNLDELRDELIRRWGPMAQIDGMAYIAKNGTFGELSEFGLQRNDFVLSCMGLPHSPTPSYQIAAAVAGLTSMHMAIDPARPLQTLVLRNVKAPALSDRMDKTDRNLLLYDGISTAYINDGNEVAIERLITMYRKNAFGEPDPSYLDVMTPHTLSYLRYATRVRFTQKYPRHKLADDDAIVDPTQPVMKPKVARAELIALYGEHEYAGLVENIGIYTDTLEVERDPNDRNRLRVLSHPDLMNQFMVYSETMQYVL